jgi:hypothetical protein
MNRQSAIRNRKTIQALKDVSFEICGECSRKGKRDEVMGIPLTSLEARLKILSRITELTVGRAETSR